MNPYKILAIINSATNWIQKNINRLTRVRRALDDLRDRVTARIAHSYKVATSGPVAHEEVIYVPGCRPLTKVTLNYRATLTHVLSTIMHVTGDELKATFHQFGLSGKEVQVILASGHVTRESKVIDFTGAHVPVSNLFAVEHDDGTWCRPPQPQEVLGGLVKLSHEAHARGDDPSIAYHGHYFGQGTTIFLAAA